MTRTSPVRVAQLFGSLVFVALLIAGAVLQLGPEAEAASWRNLDGRMAPDLVFSEARGLPANTRLSSFRNRQVVLLVFWLRDCPHCAREMPKVQQAFDLWGRSGLQVITVVHRFSLEQVLPAMQRGGWTFPVARDADGTLAQRYGGGRRPGSYVIGIDGRIKAGPSLNIGAIKTELGRWRLKELGAWPTALSTARDLVYSSGDYGGALRSAEAIARRPGASTEVKAAAARLAQIAGRKLENRVARAEAWVRARNVAKARAEYTRMVSDFKETSLAARAQALLDSFNARAGG